MKTKATHYIKVIKTTYLNNFEGEKVEEKSFNFLSDAMKAIPTIFHPLRKDGNALVTGGIEKGNPVAYELIKIPNNAKGEV